MDEERDGVFLFWGVGWRVEDPGVDGGVYRGVGGGRADRRDLAAVKA